MAKTKTTVGTSDAPKRFAIVDVAWLGALLLLLGLRGKGIGIFGDPEDPVAGILPLIVPWAGALGGIAISLIGTAKHSRDWDDTWNIWHAIRPFSGAVSGTVSFFIVVVVLRTAGGLKETDLALTLTPTSTGLFFVIAFVTGFRDTIFLNLIADVAKVIFSSGTAAPAAVSYSLDADEIDFGDVLIGGESRRTVRATLTAGGTALLARDWYRVSGDSFRCVEVPIHILGAPYRDIEITFKPTVAKPTEEELTITVGGVQREVTLKGNGVVP